jgi:hypothetical protein
MDRIRALNLKKEGLGSRVRELTGVLPTSYRCATDGMPSYSTSSTIIPETTGR